MGSSSREIQCTAIRYGCPGLFQKGPPKTTRINRFFFSHFVYYPFVVEWLKENSGWPPRSGRYWKEKRWNGMPSGEEETFFPFIKKVKRRKKLLERWRRRRLKLPGWWKGAWAINHLAHCAHWAESEWATFAGVNTSVSTQSLSLSAGHLIGFWRGLLGVIGFPYCGVLMLSERGNSWRPLVASLLAGPIVYCQTRSGSFVSF